MREASHMFEVVNHAISDPAPQALLASLTVQHNTVLEQIDAAARGAAWGGVDLLQGDTLALAFDETGASTLSMSGSVCNAAGLGLAPLAAGTDVERAAEVNLATLRVAHAALRTRRRRFQRILRWSEPPKVFRQRAGDAERPLVQCGGDRQRARQQPRAVDAPGDRDIGARARPGIADQYFAIVEPLELFRAGKLTRHTDGLHLSPQADRKQGEVAHLRCCSSRGQTGHASTQRLF
jgi:hypothetical protein